MGVSNDLEILDESHFQNAMIKQYVLTEYTIPEIIEDTSAIIIFDANYTQNVYSQNFSIEKRFRTSDIIYEPNIRDPNNIIAANTPREKITQTLKFDVKIRFEELGQFELVKMWSSRTPVCCLFDDENQLVNPTGFKSITRTEDTQRGIWNQYLIDVSGYRLSGLWTAKIYH